MISPPDYAQAIAHALYLLETALPAHLSYHNRWHTQEDVMPGAVRLARLHDVGWEEIQLLEIAAAYHDIGFIHTGKGHELMSASMVRELLPAYGFRPSQIQQVVQLILATRLPQSPHTLLGQCLADADLDTLGRADFWQRSELLRQENEACGQQYTLKAWYERQLHFLRQHHYFTAAARTLREAQKQEHIRLLQLNLDQLSSDSPLSEESFP